MKTDRQGLDYDFVVVGGGLAGVAAALAASRKGVRTALVQNRPVLGGNASSEIRVAPSGAGAYHGWAKETGIIAEVLEKEREANHARCVNGRINSAFDFALYDECRRQSGLDLYLNTNAERVEMGPGPAIRSVSAVQQGTEMRLDFRAPLFADCTGDGSVAAWAGCEAMVAEKLMGSSVLFAAVDTGRPAPFDPPEWARVFADEESLGLRHPRQFDTGYWWIEIGHPYDTIGENETIRDMLLSYVYGVWDHIKNRCTLPGLRERAESWALDWVGALPGKRESRRIVGGFVLGLEDLRSRASHFDDVCYGGWYVDLHTDGGVLAKDLPPNPVFNDLPEAERDELVLTLYPVPYRCLYARDVRNLFIAGRCFSADRPAFGSARVMCTTALMGEAVGVAASICGRRSVKPAEIAQSEELVRELRQTLVDDDVFIPGLPDRNPANLARSARATASSVRAFNAAEDPEESPGWPGPLGLVVPVEPGRIEQAEVWVSSGPEGATLDVRIEELSDVWDNGLKQESDAVCRRVVRIPPQTKGWVRIPVGADVKRSVLRLVLRSDAPISLGATRPAVPGFFRQKLERNVWHSRFGREQNLHFPVRVTPEPALFGPEAAVNGWPRPVAAPNLWISDPRERLPQWIELAWEERVTIGRVVLVLDTNLHVEHRLREGYHRSPECARDFAIQVAQAPGSRQAAGGAEVAWKTVWQERGNFLRRRECSFAPVSTDRLRLLVEATNGDPSARVYELKVYAR